MYFAFGGTQEKKGALVQAEGKKSAEMLTKS